MVQRQYTLIVEFSGKAQFTLDLDDSTTHYGDLAAKIIYRLEESYVDPLPNPKHLILKSPSGESIDPSTLFPRTLGGFYMDDEARVLTVDQGKSGLFCFKACG